MADLPIASTQAASTSASRLLHKTPVPSGATDGRALGDGVVTGAASQNRIQTGAASTECAKGRPSRAGNERQGTIDRHPKRRRFETCETIERGGYADAAAGVGAERGDAHAVGHADAGAAGRTTGHTPARLVALPAIARCAVNGLMPTPENANSTMLVRPNTAPAARKRATRASGGGRSRSQHPRPGGRDFASDIEKVLMMETVIPSSGRGAALLPER